MTAGAGPLLALVLLGLGWGLTQPLGKIAVEAGHRPLGLVFWQTAIAAGLLGAVVLARGRRIAVGRPQLAVALFVALSGTLLPNSASYLAIDHLPSGIISILLSLVPMLAFPIALALGTDRFSRARLLGLTLGLAGVALIALPEASLPDAAAVAWLPVALVAPLLYALEGNVVARWGTAGLDPFETLLGASLLGAALSLPLALGAGQFVDPLRPWGPPEWAILASGVVHASVYTGYVWLVGRAGATFAAQCSYLVTGFGVLWAMALLGERYGWSVWAALAVMLAGLALVQPRPSRAEAAAAFPLRRGGRGA